MIRSGELDRSPFAGLVQEIKHLMAALHSGSIATIGREQNLVSHLLANLGRTSSRSQIWSGSALSFCWLNATPAVPMLSD
jgi:hypothetical protein